MARCCRVSRLLGALAPDNVHESGVSPGGQSRSPHRGRGGAAGRANSNKDLSRARSEVLCPTGSLKGRTKRSDGHGVDVDTARLVDRPTMQPASLVGVSMALSGGPPSASKSTKPPRCPSRPLRIRVRRMRGALRTASRGSRCSRTGRPSRRARPRASPRRRRGQGPRRASRCPPTRGRRRTGAARAR
jgi:hypothetical protein